MRIIEFLSEPFWQQLGLTLIHFLWQGLAAVAVVAASVRLFRLGPGRPRYAAYLIAFSLMALCPLVTLTTLHRLSETEAAPHEPLVASGAPTAIETATSPPAGNLPVTLNAPARTAPADAAPEPTESLLQKWLPWAVAFWMLGVALLSLRLLLGLVGVWRWRRHRRALPQRLAGRVARLCERLGMRQFSRVFTSPAVLQATAVGCLRPMVLLPASMLTRMDPAMIEAVIAHELAHIRRLDLWVNLAQRIVETLLFYHPAVWWLSNRLRAEREFCCDEMAVAATGERLTYASALETAQRGRLAAAQPTLAMALGQGKRSTLSRVRHILGLPPAPSESRPWLAGAIVVVILAILAMPAASLMSARADAKTAKADDPLTLKLIEAAANGDVEQVKTLIAAGADVNAQDRDDKAALHYAAERGHLDVVELLVAQGADVNGGARPGWTPLLAAANKGHERIAAFLLENQADVNTTDAAGYTPLFYAVCADDEETVKTLLARGADVNKTRQGDYSPLVYAVWQWHAGNVQALVDAGADVNARDDDGWTPLYWAVDEGAPEVIRLFLEADLEISDLHRAVLEGDLARVKGLIDNGMDVDTRDGIGRPLSHWALLGGQVEVFDYLLNEGADVTIAANNGSTLLHKASSKNLPAVAQRLVAKGAAVNAGADGGKTPLFLAARLGHLEVCQLLIANGANVNTALKNGRHALGDATARGHQDAVRLLLANGADVNLSVNNRGTALHAAANYGHPPIIDMLIAAGADVNANSRLGTPLHQALRYRNGVDDETVAQIVKRLLDDGADARAAHKLLEQTPLHVAAEAGRTEAARLLIAAGADVNAKDNKGRTPLACAEGLHRSREVAEMLRKHGAKDDSATGNTEVTPLQSLHEAAARGEIGQVKALLADGADTNAKDEQGRTPLHRAATHGRKAVVEYLLAQGADVDQAAPLHRAVAYRHTAVAKVLLDSGANVNALDEGWAALHYAAAYGYTELLALLVDNGADLNARTKNDQWKGWTALHMAGRFGRGIDVAKQLIDNGADIDSRDDEGNTPLHTALRWAGQSEVVELLSDKGADVNSRNHMGRTPLHVGPLRDIPLAVKKVQILMARGADVGAKDRNGRTPLHHAAGNGFVEIVQRLITSGADVNAKTNAGIAPIDEALRIPGTIQPKLGVRCRQLDVADVLLANGADVSTINVAAYAGDLGKVKELVQDGVSVNAKHASKLMPLHTAASGGHKELVAFLIAKGAEVKAEGHWDRTPLHYAAIAGHSDVAELLIAHGAEVNAVKEEGRRTILHDAAYYCNTAVAKDLLDNGANVNAIGGVNRRAPLHEAMDGGSIEMVKLLISKGADINTDARGGATPLHRATICGHKDIAELLIAEGADVNARGKRSGNTPLDSAIRFNEREMVELLLAKGADANLADNEGRTPLSRARLKGNTEIVELLREHGAR